MRWEPQAAGSLCGSTRICFLFNIWMTIIIWKKKQSIVGVWVKLLDLSQSRILISYLYLCDCFGILEFLVVSRILLYIVLFSCCWSCGVFIIETVKWCVSLNELQQGNQSISFDLSFICVVFTRVHLINATMSTFIQVYIISCDIQRARRCEIDVEAVLSSYRIGKLLITLVVTNYYKYLQTKAHQTDTQIAILDELLTENRWRQGWGIACLINRVESFEEKLKQFYNL